MVERPLENKVCLLTGTSGGIGRRAAMAFAEAGAAVACLDLAGSPKAVAEVRAAGGQAIDLSADITSEESMADAVARTNAELGPIDVLWANAGIPGVGSVTGVTREHWDRVIAIDLTGAWITMRAVLPGMVERRQGSIIATASVSAFLGFEDSAPYTAAKGAVVALVRSAAVDYGRYGIRVNAVAPGMVPTQLLDDTIAMRGGAAGKVGASRDEITAQVAASNPLGRVGTPDDIAQLGVYLASDASSWVTGQTIVIDGGMSIR